MVEGESGPTEDFLCTPKSSARSIADSAKARLSAIEEDEKGSRHKRDTKYGRLYAKGIFVSVEIANKACWTAYLFACRRQLIIVFAVRKQAGNRKLLDTP